MNGRLLIALALTLAPASANAQSNHALQDLQASITQRVARDSGAFAEVYYRNLGSSAELALNADSSVHAASTMKIAVLIELMRRVDAGALSLEQPILVVNEFASIVDGSAYALDSTDDSDTLIYRRIGTRVPLGDLAERMIVRSSNLATNTIIATVGAREANATAHALGATRMRVLRGVEDIKAFDAGLVNTTTARDLGTLLTAIQDHRAASASSCDRMLSILEAQELNDEIPAGLPPGTRIAHKDGQITGVLHDAAIVFPATGSPFILVVLTTGIPDEQKGKAMIADIARLVWQARSN